jgi:hypothetical protein
MMKRLFTLVATLLLATGLAGCASQKLSDYADKKPTLDLAQYFEGTTHAWGMFQKRGGQVVRRFQVVMKGTVKGDQLTLDEDFTYDDGSKSQRVWTLTRGPDGRWTGTAGDVVGQAAGQQMGNAFHWTYTLALPVDGSVYNMSMDDWMYLLDEHTLLNRTSMSKFGVELGQVTLFFRKER